MAGDVELDPGGQPAAEPHDVVDRLLTPAGRSGRRAGHPVVDGLLWAGAAVPAVALGLLVSMAIRVRLGDGAWPIQDRPDPKTLGWHNTVTVTAIVASLAAVVLVPLGALGAFAAGHRRVPLRPPVVALVGFAVLLVVLWADVGGLGDWIAD